MADRRTRYDSTFGSSVSKALTEAEMTQTELAAKIKQSTAYVNQVITGRKRAAPEWIDIMADAMQLSPRERVKLHRAAAIDQGFKLTLDLTKK